MMNTIFKKINSLLVTVSLTTMVMSPVALGKQAETAQEKVSKAQLEEVIKELGLNKSMTVGEFYTQNKNKFPPRMQKMIEQLFSKIKNEPMPQFEISQAKNTAGETIATLRITGKDQLSNIQFLGEKGKYVKFDNTNLSAEDIVNFDDMVAKLYYGDANHRKGMGDAHSSPKTLKKQGKTSAQRSVLPPLPEKFTGLPKITTELWKKMTPMQRAQFMMNMRLLWSSAQDVLDAKEAQKNIKSKGKKTSSLDKWNSFFAMLNDAQAADVNCVIAGFTGTYQRNSAGKTSCNYPAGNSYVTSSCKYPCNPAIYGFADSGGAFCVPTASTLQTATSYKGYCDSQMELTTTKLSLPAASAKKDKTRYENIIDQNKAQALNDPNLEANTKKYLLSVLNSKDKAMAAAFGKGEISSALLGELVNIQNSFNEAIGKARTECAEAADEKAQLDKNFWGACDQLHGRFLLVAAYLEKTPGCKGGGKVDETTLKCSCPNGGPAALPGAVCETIPPAPPQGEVSGGAPVGGDDGKSQDQKDCEATCTAPKKCEVSKDGEGVEAWECKGGSGPARPDDGKKKGGFWSGVLKALPWVIGAGVLGYLAIKVFSPKKPKLNPAGDACPNGTIPPCGTTCQAPLALNSSGVCACPACPPGQTLTNASTCLCENTTTTTTLYVCADGYTQVSDLANCPSTATYTCWDGSTVSNPINCPEQPATTNKTETDTSR